MISSVSETVSLGKDVGLMLMKEGAGHGVHTCNSNSQKAEAE